MASLFTPNIASDLQRHAMEQARYQAATQALGLGAIGSSQGFAGLLGQSAMGSLRSGTGVAYSESVSVPIRKKNMTIREELQADTDEWLKDTI